MYWRAIAPAGLRLLRLARFAWLGVQLCIPRHRMRREKSVRGPNEELSAQPAVCLAVSIARWCFDFLCSDGRHALGAQSWHDLSGPQSTHQARSKLGRTT